MATVTILTMVAGAVRVAIPEEASYPHLIISEARVLTNGLALKIGRPDTFTNRLHMFATTNLLNSSWLVVATNLPAGGEHTLTWVDSLTNSLTKFYIAGDADTDGDLDGLADAIEMLVFRTDPARADTDGDTLPDGWESSHGLNPNDSAGANGTYGDPDHDGLSNSEEWKFGMQPDKGFVPDTNGILRLKVKTPMRRSR
jgi:hypothetical protein